MPTHYFLLIYILVFADIKKSHAWAHSVGMTGILLDSCWHKIIFLPGIWINSTLFNSTISKWTLICHVSHKRHESPIPTQRDAVLSPTETKAVKTLSTLREDWAQRFSGRLKPEAVSAGGPGLKTLTPVGGAQGCIQQVILSGSWCFVQLLPKPSH